MPQLMPQREEAMPQRSKSHARGMAKSWGGIKPYKAKIEILKEDASRKIDYLEASSLGFSIFALYGLIPPHDFAMPRAWDLLRWGMASSRWGMEL